jgi:hypothetical protein
MNEVLLKPNILLVVGHKGGFVSIFEIDSESVAVVYGAIICELIKRMADMKKRQDGGRVSGKSQLKVVSNAMTCELWIESTRNKNSFKLILLHKQKVSIN